MTDGKGWPTVRFGDVIDVRYGKALSRANRREGSFPVYGSNGVVGWHDEALTSGPTVIIGRKGSSGAVNVSAVPCWPIDTAYYVDDPGPFHWEFLEHLLVSLRLDELDRSTAIPSLGREQLYDIEVPLPSLKEQAFLAQQLVQLAGHRLRVSNHLAAARRTIELLRQAVLAAACSGRLTADWRSDGSGDADDLPADWQVLELKEFATRVTKGTTPTTYGHKFTDSGVSFVKVENLMDGRIDRDSIRSFIADETHRLQGRSILEPGDILFSIAGTIGRTAVVRQVDLPANTNQALAIIRGASHVVIPEYLVLALQGATQNAAAAASRGSSMNNISLADVKRFEVAVPLVGEQEEIVRRVRALTEGAEAVSRAITAAERGNERVGQAALARALGDASHWDGSSQW